MTTTPFCSSLAGLDIEGSLTHEYGVPVEVCWRDGAVTPLLPDWRAVDDGSYTHLWTAIAPLVRAELADVLAYESDEFEQSDVMAAYIAAGTSPYVGNAVA